MINTFHCVIDNLDELKEHLRLITNEGVTMKIKLDEKAVMPTRAHDTDAGLDLRTPIAFNIKDEKIIDTGVHVELPHGTVGLIKSKSGLNTKYGITCEGVIDEGYTGSIVVRLLNTGDYTLNFDRGDKIAQLVIVPCLTPDIEIVDELQETERGDNGFGSTGK